MEKYLLDTKICIYYIKGLYDLNLKIEEVGVNNCFISEITLAELKFGAENSIKKKKNLEVLDNFVSCLNIIPIFNAIDLYAREKTRLRKSGIIIDEFDLLIGCTAIAHKMVMVTKNTKHFIRLQNIRLEDWTIS